MGMPVVPVAVVYPQVEQSAIMGLVSDPSDAAVPQRGRPDRQSCYWGEVGLKTNARREFTPPPLRPKTYTVTVQASGFKRTIETIAFDVNQHARANCRLQLGSASQEISISGEAP